MLTTGPVAAYPEVLAALLRDRYGVLLSLGRKDTAGRVLRIGHMGPSAQPIHAATIGEPPESLGDRIPGIRSN